jgi:hypothetical protein
MVQVSAVEFPVRLNRMRREDSNAEQGKDRRGNGHHRRNSRDARAARLLLMNSL